VEAAEQLGAAAIIAVTVSGYTAQSIAQRRPRVPLIAAVPDARAARALALVWGVAPAAIPWQGDSADFLDRLERELKARGLVRPGDTVVILSGSTALRGADFMLKIQTVGA